jgi:hypothetical protein
MRSRGEIWQQRLWVWVPALLFFLANATAYTVYRFGFADRLASLQDDLQAQKEKLDPLTQRKNKIAALLDRAQRNDEEIRALYAEKFSTRKERLTKISAEVKSLARKAGLNPKSLSYPENAIQQYGLVKRSFIFSVDGTYVDLRKFINLLELSNSFLTLESVTLSPGSAERPVKGRAVEPSAGSELHISLTLSTLFASDPNDPNALNGTAPLPAARRAAS